MTQISIWHKKDPKKNKQSYLHNPPTPTNTCALTYTHTHAHAHTHIYIQTEASEMFSLTDSLSDSADLKEKYMKFILKDKLPYLIWNKSTGLTALHDISDI